MSINVVVAFALGVYLLHPQGRHSWVKLLAVILYFVLNSTVRMNGGGP